MSLPCVASFNVCTLTLYIKFIVHISAEFKESLRRKRIEAASTRYMATVALDPLQTEFYDFRECAGLALDGEATCAIP